MNKGFLLRHKFKAGKVLHSLCSVYIAVVDPDTGKSILVPCRHTQYDPIHYTYNSDKTIYTSEKTDVEVIL